MSDDLERRLRTHFDGCREIPGEKSFTRPLVIEAADEIARLKALLAGQDAGLAI